ncbi:MAG: hypothetical protein IPJ76_01975 [Flavobacteriales bacterium]|nr:MAG: hypothetical protein IPJ76_01975 [Flavobacteriales bacterium]
MKFLLPSAALLVSALAVSCGGSSDPDKKQAGDFPLEVEQTMSGTLSESYIVTKAVLKVSEEIFGTKLLVEIKRTDEPLPFDANDAQVCGVGAGKKYQWCIAADMLGEGDLPLATNLEKYGYEPFEKALSLGANETAWLEFSLSGNTELEKNPGKAKKVKLSSSMEEQDTSPITSSGDSESSGDIALTGDEDWDDILTSYEQYVDDYIKLAKAAKNGDASAIAEYPAMMENATELQSKLQNAGSNLTAEQLGRFSKLQAKLMNAAANLQ